MIQLHNDTVTGSVPVVIKTVLGVLTLVIIATAFYFSLISMRVFNVCSFLLLPSILTMVADRSSNRFYSLVVCMCNISGLMVYLPDALKAFNYRDAYSVLDVLMTRSTILAIYSCSILGLLICFLLPKILTVCYMSVLQNKKQRTRDKMNKLHNEWDMNGS